MYLSVFIYSVEGVGPRNVRPIKTLGSSILIAFLNFHRYRYYLIRLLTRSPTSGSNETCFPGLVRRCSTYTLLGTADVNCSLKTPKLFFCCITMKSPFWSRYF
uniref:Uncharacterized protein n=1 Tax=Sinocyclocheilus grahami TaxID=75366 RepID=A0A672PTU1_SINGR